MADIVYLPNADTRELRDHQKAFAGFSRLVLFAVLHIALVLACLALAFVGNAPLMGLVLGVAGTAGLIVAIQSSVSR